MSTSLFVFSPILGGLFSYFSLLFIVEEKKKVLPCFAILSALLGLINALKIPTSDLQNYLEMFRAVENNNFIEYIFSEGKEPIFFTLNYILFHLVNGSETAYIILFTFICYFILFFSIWKMHLYLRLGLFQFMLAIGVAFLFPNLFSLSAHLMRQFLAGSILLYVLVQYIFYDKRNIILFVLAGFTHTTAFIFSCMFLPILKKKILLKNLMIVLILFGAIFFIVNIFADSIFSLFSFVPFLSYSFLRISNVETSIDLEQVSYLSFFLQSFIVYIFFNLYKKGKVKDKPIQILFYISLMLLLFVAYNFNNTEIALRFSFFSYFLFPIASYFILSNKLLKIIGAQKIIFLFTLLTLMYWFVWKLNYGIWIYEDLAMLAFFPTAIIF